MPHWTLVPFSGFEIGPFSPKALRMSKKPIHRFVFSQLALIFRAEPAASSAQIYVQK
jgi:hypothetical protein